MVKVVTIALSLGLLFNLIVLRFLGIEGFSESVITYLPKGLEALIAIGIVTEARFSGLHTRFNEWKSFSSQLIMLLVIALTLRGIAIFLVAQAFGLQHASIIATGLTATDPAAIGISLAMVKVRRLQTLFWLLTVESLLNDAEGLLLFNMANGGLMLASVKIISLTILMAFFLACADTYTRLFIRTRWKNQDFEARAEILAAFIVYVLSIIVGINLGVSLIGMCAIGSILADYAIQKIPHERRHDLEHQRIHLQEKWSEWGLGLVLFLVVMLMPFRLIFTNLSFFIIALSILGGILLARFAYDIFSSNMRRKDRQTESVKAGVSILASLCLLGVPSVVASEMFEQGMLFESAVVFTTILLSWVTIFPTIFYIKWSDRKLGKVNRQNGEM